MRANAIRYAIKHVCAIAIDIYIINIIGNCHQYTLRNCYRECYLIAIAYVIYMLSGYAVESCYQVYVIKYVYKMYRANAIGLCYIHAIWLCYRVCDINSIEKCYPVILRVYCIYTIWICYQTCMHNCY